MKGKEERAPEPVLPEGSGLAWLPILILPTGEVAKPEGRVWWLAAPLDRVSRTEAKP